MRGRQLRTLQAIHASGPTLPLSGLILRLDGTSTATMTRTGARVDQWNDLSGGSHHFGTGFAGTGNNPTFDATLLGGRGAVKFVKGSSHLIQSLSNFSSMNRSSWTMLFALRCTAKGSVFLFSDHTASFNYAGLSTAGRMGPHSYYSCSYGYPLNTPVIQGARNNTGVLHHLLNNTIYSNYHSTQNYATSVTLGAANLGFGASGPFGADMGYVLIYNRALSDAEFLQASKWLQKKFAIVVDPLQALPNRNVIFDGNSIPYGMNTGNTLGTIFGPEAIASLGYTAYDWKMVAFPGQNTLQMQSAYAARVAPLYDSRLLSKYNVLFAHEITNSLLNGGYTAAQVESQLSGYVSAAHATGFKVVLATCLPRTSAGANFETDRQAVNAWLLAGNSGADAIADFGGDATIGVQAAASNTTYYADGTHPTDLTHQTYLAPLAKTAIQGVMA
jgi:hypothetical protein